MRTPLETELADYGAKMRVERDYVLAQLRRPKAERTTAIVALIEYAVDCRSPDLDEYPRDPDELLACERLYREAPPWIQPDMLVLLQQYRIAIAKRWGQHLVSDNQIAARDEPRPKAWWRGLFA